MPVSFQFHRCLNCDEFVGYPNVRAAEVVAETMALARRLAEAEAEAGARGAGETLVRFRAAVRGSKAVICKPMAEVFRIVKSEEILYSTFYDLIFAGVRLPEDNEFDLKRQRVDSHLFPLYYPQIRFAALSLDGRGLDSYGDFSVVLRSDILGERATVYEENTYLFFDRLKILTLEDPPAGHRATWARRDELAAAKLHRQLEAGTDESSFPGILLKSSGDPRTDDFVEVHIYGKFNRRSFERVIGKKPNEKSDLTIVENLRDALRADDLDIPIELIP